MRAIRIACSGKGEDAIVSYSLTRITNVERVEFMEIRE